MNTRYTIQISTHLFAAIAAFMFFGCPSKSRDGNNANVDEAPGTKVEPETEKKPETAVDPSTGCTVDYAGPTVDGSSLWADIPDARRPKNCNFHRFAYNNFLYMVGSPTPGATPRFMTDLESTLVLAKTHKWAPTGVLTTRTIRNVPSKEFEDTQALDGFQLIDVAKKTVLYDIRIDKTMWDSIAANQWDIQGDKKSGLIGAQNAYNANSQTGGIWLPPNNTGDPSIQDPSGDDSIEIKTSWRNYGQDASACPASLMFCMKDSKGDTLGLLGMHFVQKTPTRGEWVWASFEHVANAPDCNPGSSNPLQKDPRDPTDATKTINVNSGALANNTGWTAFDFSTYSAGGGNGTTCDFSKGTATSSGCTVTGGTSQCNGNPNASKGTGFVQTNICRTDAIPDHSTPSAVKEVCAQTSDNGDNVACITQSVLDNWPSGLDPRWKYYMLIGTEWLDANSVQKVGCFGITNTATSEHDFACPSTPPQTFPTTGSVDLANTTMESWMQMGTCISYESGGTSQTVGARDCFSCHTPETTTSFGDLSHIFSAFSSSN